MIPRWLHVASLGVAMAALEFAASFGTTPQVWLAYAGALALGVVVYYQGEKAVTPEPVFANVAAAMVIGPLLSLVVATALLRYYLGMPVDFALWRVGIVMWSTWLGIAFAFICSFFVTGLGAAIS